MESVKRLDGISFNVECFRFVGRSAIPDAALLYSIPIHLLGIRNLEGNCFLVWTLGGLRRMIMIKSLLQFN